MTTTEHRPFPVPSATDVLSAHALQKRLASAYAERLSCWRCDATEDELADNALLIRRLEAQYRSLRDGDGIADRRLVDLSDRPATMIRIDPAQFLG